MVNHLEANKLLSPEQFGFREKRSCVYQLLECMEAWTSLLDEGTDIDILYFDFSKAFDSVPHVRLIAKLQAYGIGSNVLSWIHDSLKDRKQRVVLDSFKSDWSDVISVVPQGSVLGPLLFLVYINDLPKNVQNCKVKIFADDKKLYYPSDGN